MSKNFDDKNIKEISSDEVSSFTYEFYNKFKLYQTNETGLESLFKNIPSEYKTYELCLKIVSIKGVSLKHVPNHLKTQELIFTAISQDSYALKYVPQLTTNMCLFSVQHSKNFKLQDIPKKFRTKQICFESVNRDVKNLEYVSHQTPEICKLALNKDPGVALNLIKKINYKLIEHSITSMHNNKYSNLLGFLKKIDKQMPKYLYLSCLSHDPYSLYSIERKDPNMCLIALNSTRKFIHNWKNNSQTKPTQKQINDFEQTILNQMVGVVDKKYLTNIDECQKQLSLLSNNIIN